MDVSREVSAAIGGRRLVTGLGAAFVALVACFPLLPLVDDASTDLWIVLGILAGVPGLVLLYGGYRLPRTDLRPEHHATVGAWCLRGMLVGVAILALIVAASDDANVISNTLLLTALGGVAGFGAGSYDARAKTRQSQLEETVEELQTANERLERYRQYTDDVLDSIDDIFYVLSEDGELERWNESLAAVTGYSGEEIDDMNATDFFVAADRDGVVEAVRTGFEDGSTHVEVDLQTRNGETIPFEFVASKLEAPSGETVLAGIGRDMSERVEREQRLEELVAELEASNDRLEQFAYAASHDLQEPLRMVSTYLQLIENQYEDDLDQDGREYLAFAVDGADRMRDMIDGLLEYSRIETEGDPFERVDLNDVLDEAVDDLQVTIQERDADVAVEDLPVVEGDPSQLRQVFQNLLSNAIKYSDEPPRVQVSAVRVDAAWEVSVRDEGIGIDPADADRIFDIFERLHSREEHPGAGIGLALSERIVERHNGEIGVDSEPGEGTTFTVSLPATDQP